MRRAQFQQSVQLSRLLCGVYYGISIFLCMNLVVLPLSAFPVSFAPFKTAALIQGMVMHVLLVGLPISVSFRILGQERSDSESRSQRHA